MAKEDKTDRVLTQAHRGRRFKKVPMSISDVDKLLEKSNELLSKGQQAEGVDVTWKGKKKRYDDITVEVVYPTFDRNNS